MGEILNYFRKLGEVDTEGVEPLKHGLVLESALREDEPRESITPEEALKNAPKCRGDYFEVPKVF